MTRTQISITYIPLIVHQCHRKETTMSAQVLTSRSTTARAASLLVALAFALGALAPFAAPAYAADCQARHIVQRGETLFRIGLRYGLPWDRIAKANNIADANKIFAGQVLCIPTADKPQPEPDVVIVLPTDVQYVLALTDVNMRVGPSLDFAVKGKISAGQIAKVTGVSANREWWRVICPDGTTGNCWITAGSRYTQPTTAPGPSKPSGVPTITITTVVRDQSVTIQAANFPAGYKFDVLMGAYGTAGVNGQYVTTTDSGKGGSFSVTYTIPAALRGSQKIALRLQNTSGYYSYNWFWNNSTAAAN
jgi:LysM repeat protein